MLDARTKEINSISFANNIANLTDLACLQLFHFNRDNIMRIVPLVGWPSEMTRTAMNGYRVDPFMATCIFLLLMATLDRWYNLKLLFDKHAPHLSEIFRESLQNFMHTSGDLVTSPIPGAFFEQYAQRYVSAVNEKNGCMYNTVAFIDGTVIGVARPGGPYVM